VTTKSEDKMVKLNESMQIFLLETRLNYLIVLQIHMHFSLVIF